MSLTSRKFFLAAVALLMTTSTVWGGGLCLYELGTPDVGLAASGYAARAQDPFTSFTNPARMTRLERWEPHVAIQSLYVHSQFDPDSRTTTGPDGDASACLPAASLSYFHNLSRDFKLGIGLFGYFGLDLEYEDEPREPNAASRLGPPGSPPAHSLPRPDAAPGTAYILRS